MQAFAHQPVEELVDFDLIVLDHPSIGAAVAREALFPLDDHLDADFLADQLASSVGRSFESYTWEGRQWALAIDAARNPEKYTQAPEPTYEDFARFFPSRRAQRR